MKENIVQFPDRGLITEEAGAWLIRLDGEQPLTADEQAALKEWLQRSPLHREELDKMAALWGRMNVLTELAVPLGKSPAASQHPSEQNTRRGAFAGMGRLGIATAVLVIGLVTVFGLWMRPDPMTASNGFYATAVGQQQQQALADGSVVLLNTNSQIRVEYGTDYRDIRLLQGEVYFKVAKNSDQPFRVFAGNGLVQAVGTAFSVYLKNSAVDVTVTEGRVALASLSNSRARASGGQSRVESAATRADTVGVEYSADLGLLSAGQSTTIRAANEDTPSDTGSLDVIQTVDATEMTKRLSWQHGMLTFAGDPLEQVVEEISRYTTVSIEISDPAVRAIKIGGQFQVGATDDMLAALEVNFGLRVTRLGDDRILLAAAESPTVRE